jgi:RND superfamily putative drug exporter
MSQRQRTNTDAHSKSSSITQRLARVSALHPWRILYVWGLVLAVSVLAAGTLIGSAFNSDGSITSNPDSVKAEKVLGDNFSQEDRIDDAVVIYSAGLTSDAPEFKAFVEGVRSSIEDTGATEDVRDPYAAAGSGISEDGHAAVVTLVLGPDPENGILAVLDKVTAADADAAFEVDITGANTLDHDFTKLSESDLTNGELKFGLPAAMIVLILVFGALVAAFIPMGIAIISIIVTVAISSVLGQFTSISFFIVNMITAMGLALGIDYSLFVLSRYREERQAGRNKIDAIVTTGGTSSKAVLFSGSSFVVALLGLLLVPDTILRSLALGAIIVGLVTMAAALTLLPALLSLLGDRVNSLRLPIVGRDHAAESPMWTKAVSAVVRRPGTFLVAGVLLLLAAAFPVLGLHTGTSGVGSLPDDTFAKSGALPKWSSPATSPPAT